MADTKVFCGHCGEAGTKACSGCRNISYCSVECQQADWPVHKLLCKHFIEFKTRPHPDTRRGIFIPPTGDKPKFIWFEVRPCDVDSDPEDEDSEDRNSGNGEDGGDDMHSREDVGEATGVPYRDRERGSTYPNSSDISGFSMGGDMALVVGKTGGGERLDHTIRLRCLDYFLNYPPNPCLYKLVGGRTAKRMRGPMMFYGMTKVEHSRFTVDLDTADLTIALNALVENGKRAELGMMAMFYELMPKPLKKVQGVKISAKDGVFEDVEIPVKHPIFSDGTTSQITKKFGPALLTWQAKKSAPTAGVAENAITLTAYLHLSIDAAEETNEVNETNFGSVSTEWYDRTNTVLVARTARRPTSSTVVEMACNFCRDEILPLLTPLKGGSREEAEALAAVDEMARTKWEKVVEDSVADMGKSLRRMALCDDR